MAFYMICGACALMISTQTMREDNSIPTNRDYSYDVSVATITTDASARLPRARDGHYWANARVNDVPIKFLVDTGATDVALTTSDAKKIGLNLDTPSKFVTVNTANGRTQAKLYNLTKVRVGSVEVRNVEAIVMDGRLGTSLLGMSFMNRMRGWEVTPDAIVIRSR